MCFRERPRSFGPAPMGPFTFVAITIWSRGLKSRSARPRISSLAPLEYTSAVSKKLMPHSRAVLTILRLARSLIVHRCHCGNPKDIVPRQIFEILRPAKPSFTKRTAGRLPARSNNRTIPPPCKGDQARFDDVLKRKPGAQTEFQRNGRLRISLIGQEYCKTERCDHVPP